MGSFRLCMRSDNKRYAVEVRWGIFIENLTYFFFIPSSGHKYSIQTLIIPPWLLLRKMIISQLELRPPVVWKINLNQTGRRDKATSHRSTTVTSFLRQASVDQEKMLKVYTSSVRSVPEYAVPVYNPFQKIKIKQTNFETSCERMEHT